MDKPDFLHKLKGLPAFRCPEQTLYRICTEGVQILRLPDLEPFCTFAPVDMHGFVHTRLARQGRVSSSADAGRQEEGQVTDGFVKLVGPGGI